MAESSNDNMSMDDDHRRILRIARKRLVKDMDPCDVLIEMGASTVFSDKDEEEIMSKETKFKQNTTFFDLLLHRGPNAYDSFKDALQRGHAQFLAYILTDAENKFKLEKELNNSAGLRKILKEVLTSAKERVTTNRPESEVDELKNDSDKDNERVDTSLNKQSYPNNNEQFQSLDDLSKEKRCQQCCDLKKDNEVLRSKLNELHGILSQYEEEKEPCEIAEKCPGEKLKRHDKKDNKRQTGKNLEEQRTEETQSKSKNDKESLKAELDQKIKTSSNEKKMVGEIPGKGYRELSTRKDEDQLCADKWKSGTVSGTYDDDHLPRLPGKPMTQTGSSSSGSRLDDDDENYCTPGPHPRNRTGGYSRKTLSGIEPLQIVKHPTLYQTYVEGSTVTFKCKAKGKYTVIYQWLKDGTKIQGKDSCSLVLENVGAINFGWYSCRVRYADGQSLESCLGELDVFPRVGMRFRYLNEAFEQFPDTQRNVENLLVKKVTGSELWKQVALKWNMDSLSIESLQSSSEVGNEIISYLKAKNPELTVYEFCYFLKKPNIRRLDIVSALSDHLVSVSV